MKRVAAFLAVCAIFLQPVESACDPPFLTVGTLCIYPDTSVSGTWYDMRLHCVSVSGGQGDLARIDDANELATIYNFLMDFGLNRANYWIGASDEAGEGTWTWETSVGGSAGDPAPMGSPYWMYDCDAEFPQRPRDDATANCAALDVENHFHFADYSCLGDTGDIPFSPLCEI